MRHFFFLCSLLRCLSSGKFEMNAGGERNIYIIFQDVYKRKFSKIITDEPLMTQLFAKTFQLWSHQRISSQRHMSHLKLIWSERMESRCARKKQAKCFIKCNEMQTANKRSANASFRGGLAMFLFIPHLGMQDKFYDDIIDFIRCSWAFTSCLAFRVMNFRFCSFCLIKQEEGTRRH